MVDRETRQPGLSRSSPFRWIAYSRMADTMVHGDRPDSQSNQAGKVDRALVDFEVVFSSCACVCFSRSKIHMRGCWLEATLQPLGVAQLKAPLSKLQLEAASAWYDLQGTAGHTLRKLPDLDHLFWGRPLSRRPHI